MKQRFATLTPIHRAARNCSVAAALALTVIAHYAAPPEVDGGEPSVITAVSTTYAVPLERHGPSRDSLCNETLGVLSNDSSIPHNPLDVAPWDPVVGSAGIAYLEHSGLYAILDVGWYDAFVVNSSSGTIVSTFPLVGLGPSAGIAVGGAFVQGIGEDLIWVSSYPEITGERILTAYDPTTFWLSGLLWYTSSDPNSPRCVTAMTWDFISQRLLMYEKDLEYQSMDRIVQYNVATGTQGWIQLNWDDGWAIVQRPDNHVLITRATYGVTDIELVYNAAQDVVDYSVLQNAPMWGYWGVTGMCYRTDLCDVAALRNDGGNLTIGIIQDGRCCPPVYIDLNDDGLYNVSDVVIMLDSVYGPSIPRPGDSADLDNDSDVDISDLAIFQALFHPDE